MLLIKKPHTAFAAIHKQHFLNFLLVLFNTVELLLFSTCA